MGDQLLDFEGIVSFGLEFGEVDIGEEYPWGGDTDVFLFFGRHSL